MPDQKLWHARSNGGHKWHVLPCDTERALCGYEPRGRRRYWRRMEPRARWVTWHALFEDGQCLGGACRADLPPWRCDGCQHKLAKA